MGEEAAAPGTPVWASLSSRGGRPDNQDRCGDTATPTGRVFIVADGLGGHAAGEVAADACVTALIDALRGGGALAPARLDTALEVAQRAVQKASEQDAEAAGCRTTAVVLEISLDRALWGHVGDTRLYHFRGGRIRQQTLDHSVPQALVQAGDLQAAEIRGHPERNRLLKSLGGEGNAEPTVLEAPVALESSDAFLLCTDGFWELVPEADMEAALDGAAGPAVWLERMEAQVLRDARGAFDNYSATAVMVRTRTAPPPSAPWIGRVVLAAALALSLLAVAGGVSRCIQGPATPPLILSAAPAPGLPAGERGPGSPSGLQLHSTPAEPRASGRS